MMVRVSLRFVRESNRDTSYVYRGDEVIGFITLVKDAGKWKWKLDAVNCSWIGLNGYGYVKTEAYARRALTRAWERWCERHGLIGDESMPYAASIAAP